MPTYTPSQVKDLLRHIVSEVDERYGQALINTASDSSDILSPINLAAALRAIGIAAQAETKTLVTKELRPNDPEIAQILSSREVSPHLSVMGVLFSPHQNMLTSWGEIMNDPHFLNIQSDDRSKGFSSEWLGPHQPTCPETPEHVTDLLEIMREWQAAVQQEVLTQKLSATKVSSKVSPFKKM